MTNNPEQTNDSNFDNDVAHALTKNQKTNSLNREDRMLTQSASGDGFPQFSSMLDPCAAVAPKLTARHAEEFVLNLSKDHFLKTYLQSTSREPMRTRVLLLRRSLKKRTFARSARPLRLDPGLSKVQANQDER